MATTDFRLYHDSDAGPDGYCAEWHRTLKDLVREQSGHRCVRCKHPYQSGKHGRGEWSPCDEHCLHHGPYRYRLDGWGNFQDEWQSPIAGDLVAEAYEVHAAWRILTVHHLDGNKLNCRWWNLAALCQRCHLTIQGRVKMDRPWLLDHSEWFKPYVAGYYASQHGLELSREEVMSRLDELLEMGQGRRVARA